MTTHLEDETRELTADGLVVRGTMVSRRACSDHVTITRRDQSVELWVGAGEPLDLTSSMFSRRMLLTPGEARALAVRLVRLADEVETAISDLPPDAAEARRYAPTGYVTDAVMKALGATGDR